MVELSVLCFQSTVLEMQTGNWDCVRALGSFVRILVTYDSVTIITSALIKHNEKQLGISV